MRWGELSSPEHFVQIYDGDTQLLESLESYVVHGITSGDSVIVIATSPHRQDLERRLRSRGIDVDAARRSDDYIALDAEEILSSILDGGWPDEDKFRGLLSKVLSRARQDHSKLRAFGEMVAVMWGRGQAAATLRSKIYGTPPYEKKSCSCFVPIPVPASRMPTSNHLK